MLEDLGNSASADDCFGRSDSEMESEQQVVEQCKNSTSENCTRADPQLNICEDDVPETDLTQRQKYFPPSVDAEQCDSESCGQSVPLSESEPYASNDKVPKADSMLQGYPPISVDSLDPESERCIPEVVEVEIQNDRTDETSALSGESDSDCVIEYVSGTESHDRQPVEGKVAVNAVSLDHAYCLSADSVRHSAVVTSSGGICQEYTPVASGTNLSMHSLQTSDFYGTTVLPFPNLNTGDLCSQSRSGEHPADSAFLFGVAPTELMDMEVSAVSSNGDDENECLVVNSFDHYPVVEIVPRSEKDEGGDAEQSQLSSDRAPSSAVHITGLPAVADAHSDNTPSDAVAAASSSQRVRASILTFGTMLPV